MDIQAAIGKFLGPDGSITMPPQLTLAGLSETLFQASAAAGEADKPLLRYWDYSTHREGEVVEITRRGMNTRVKAVAARLQQVASPGDKVAVLAGNSPEYIMGILGAMYAGMVAVPLYDPKEPGHQNHLEAVLADCRPTVLLTTMASAPSVRALFAQLPGSERPRILAIDALPDSVASQYRNPLQDPAAQAAISAAGTDPVDLVCFLQYTSGSTRTPAGVMLTNRSIMTNIMQIFLGAQLQLPIRLVSWLPLHHDMGIILALFTVILGLELDMMSPRDFLQRPGRWVALCSARPQAADGGADTVGVFTVVPNFALELTARYGSPEQLRSEGTELDLSLVQGLIVGSEPVTVKAVTAFADTFGPVGLAQEAIRPTYGAAEASLLISTPQQLTGPRVLWADRAALNSGTVTPVKATERSAVALMSNGSTVAPQRLIVVDPDTREELPEGSIGEFWAHGENMAAGYLGRPEETQATFHNTVAAFAPEGSAAAGAPNDGWMATGDLGALIDGQVYITGRRKDLIVIAGRNHYPQDIEYTVDHACTHVRPAAVAAFSVEDPAGGVEKLIIFAERDRGTDSADDAPAIEAIREAVTAAHGIVPADIRFFAPDEIARSTSGKIARRVNKQRYLDQLS